MPRNAFDSVSSVFKSRSEESSKRRFAIEFESEDKSKSEEYRSFEGKRRGHKHH
jgi:hypothetical protein